MKITTKMDIPTQHELIIDPYRQLVPAGDRVSQFLLLLTEFERGWLQIPPHQREPDAWNHLKRLKYVNRLKDSRVGSHPTGSFATYQLSSGSSTFLNDGYQRLTTLALLRADPTLFAMDEEGVEQLLRQDASVQHRHYPSHDEAMLDFQLINYGTRLTPLELCRGYLSYMEDYDIVWKPIIDDIENAISETWQRVRTSQTVAREKEHKLRRHALSLFYRFLTQEKAPKQYIDVGRQDVQELAEKHQVIEWQLREFLERMGHELARKEARRFKNLVDRETALFEEIRDMTLAPGVGLTPVLHRWLLDFSVWCKNNKVPVERQKLFITRLLKGTGGGSQWSYEDSNGRKRVVTLGLAHLGTIPDLARLAGVPEIVDEAKRRRKTGKLRPGYQNSHIVPFVKHGEGETFPEAAPLNLARGAQRVVK